MVHRNQLEESKRKHLLMIHTGIHFYAVFNVICGGIFVRLSLSGQLHLKDYTGWLIKIQHLLKIDFSQQRLLCVIVSEKRSF